MHISWKDAPEWARWLAMDRDGIWFWFEWRPVILDDIGVWQAPRGRKRAAIPSGDWKATRRERPSQTTSPPSEDRGEEGQRGA